MNIYWKLKQMMRIIQIKKSDFKLMIIYIFINNYNKIFKNQNYLSIYDIYYGDWGLGIGDIMLFLLFII